VPKIQFRRDTAAQWTTHNPVLLAGEIGIETDTYRFKLGDGVTAWTGINYSSKALVDDPEDYVRYLDISSITYVNDLATSITYENGSLRNFTYNVSDLVTQEVITDTDGTTALLTVAYTYDASNQLQTVTRS
tara:strand:- start:1469 stop:1864 length:396 start_codon:yes stop_codon:yes gene_type:complete